MKQIVLYGEVMLNINLGRMIAFHKNKRAVATLALHPDDHPFDSDLAGLDDKGRITASIHEGTRVIHAGDECWEHGRKPS